MANSSIYEKIEKQGALEAKEIYQNGVNKALEYEEKVLTETKQEIDKVLKKHLERNADSIKTKVTEIEQKAKQRSLSKKKALIDDAFKTALQKLKALDDKTFCDFVNNLVNSDNLSSEDLIMVNKEDYPRYIKLFSTGKMANGLYILDKLNNLKLANEHAQIEGGFIVIGKKFDINHSYETLLTSLQDQDEAAIAKMLFAEE